VIPAVEALQLPTAQLSPDELVAADGLESMIEQHVKTSMTRQGVNIEIKEARPDIIADVSQRLKAAGYQAQWAPLVEAHPLNKAQQQLVGFRLSLAPSDESYRAAARAVLS
jgi:hypothetical protein